MSPSSYQIYKTATPMKNSETGEIFEDIICVKCNSFINEETGELEETQKDLFKIPKQKQVKNSKVGIKCDLCCHDSHNRSLILILVALTFLPTLAILLYVAAETFTHWHAHKHNKDDKKEAPSSREKLHCLFYSQFCAFCQANRSMNVVSKLQDERLEKMRRYVKNIPIQ